MKRFSFIFCGLFSLILFSKTIVSMAPNMTETVFFLGCDSMLVGRTLYCDYPIEAMKIQIAGTFMEMDYEKIISLKPDLVLFSSNITQTHKKFLNQQKIEYADIKMESADGVILGLYKADSLLTGGLNSKKIDSLKSLLEKELPRKSSKAFLEISSNPLVSAGKLSYAGSIMSKMGWFLLDSNKPYQIVSQEDVIKFNPSLAIIFHSESKIEERIGWQNVSAVKSKRVIYLTDEERDALSRPGPRIIKAFEILENISEKNSL